MAAWRYEISLLVLKKYFTRSRIFQHSKRNLVSPCSHVISSIYFQMVKKVENISGFKWTAWVKKKFVLISSKHFLAVNSWSLCVFLLRQDDFSTSLADVNVSQCLRAMSFQFETLIFHSFARAAGEIIWYLSSGWGKSCRELCIFFFHNTS